MLGDTAVCVHPTDERYSDLIGKQVRIPVNGRVIPIVADALLAVGEYGPGEIKLAVVGSGSADKGQVTYMVRTILALDHDPKPDHAADALAAAICHANQRVARARVAGAEAS